MATENPDIVLPWPPVALSPNSRIHRMPFAKAKKQYRQDAYFATCAVRHKINLPPEGPLRVVMVFAPPVARKRDHDNLIARMKSGLDGIADALHVNDERFVVWPPQILLGPHDHGGEVRVKITPETNA